MKKIKKISRLLDPGLAEFVYTVAATAPIAAKRFLPSKYFDRIKTEKTARRFARTATDEQKREFLGYLGYKSVTIIANADLVWNPDLKDVLKQYEDTKKVSALANMLNESVYIINDKKHFDMLSMLADIVASPAYKRHMEAIRAQKGQIGWPVKLDTKKIESKDKSEDIASYIKVIYSGIEDLVLCESYFEFSPVEFKALMYFFLKRGEYISFDEISQEMIGFVNLKATRPILRSLLDGLYIQPHFDSKNQSYCITTRGIKAIMDFCERSIIKLNNAA